MAMRCSLLGHDFGDAEMSREREEQGDEVVVTVVEYEACDRCGSRNVLSETTEVRPIAGEDVTADDPPGVETVGTDGSPGSDTEDRTRTPSEPDDPADEGSFEFVEPADGAVDGVSALDEPGDLSTPADASGETRGASEGSERADSGDEADVTEDAEILEEDEPTRERGVWPEANDVERADDGSSDAPDVEDTITPTDDAEILDAPSTSVEDSVTDSATGIASAGVAPVPGEAAATEDAVTEFYCPQCSFAVGGNSGSLRPGDICPECKRGYLGERER